jgi:amino acid adenylation domain-containing protein/non-ribosomal peptide synthase protein (TIGR01720 family)
VGRVREVTLGAYAHQEVPFERLVEELQPERSLSHTPLFQVTFGMHNAPRGELRLPGLKLSRLSSEGETAKFDLMLSMMEGAGGLLGLVEYSTDLFDESTIERMVGHFEVLLEAAALTPDARLSALPVLTETERRLLLHDWNRTAADYPRQSCVHELFEQQAALTPEAVALVYGDEEVTYRELNERANRLAHHLRGVGVGAESRVGLCVGRSAELVVGLLGILKAGGAYVPLDPSYPAERLAWMMEDAGVAALVSEEEAVEELPAFWGPVVFLDSDADLLEACSAENPGTTATADNLAYVIYTSGSTGRPKGVAVTHRAVSRLLFSQTYVRFGAEETFLLLAPVSFDASTFEIWGALLHGARLVIAPPAPPSLSELAALLERHRVSVLWLTAGLFHQMADSHSEVLGSVRQVVAGGDVLSARHCARVLGAMAEGERLVNGYGPTEVTTFACCRVMEAEAELGAGGVPIGSPIANTRAYVVDAAMKLVPAGVSGELYLGGDGMARGYLNHPSLTAERFVPDPFSVEAGGRLYRTGDVAWWSAQGELEFVGRADSQVKVRGFRIEPGEIEAALSTHAEVRECAVVVREDRRGDKRLVAYVAAAVGGTNVVSSGELRTHLKGRLPEYMIPSAFVTLDALPLSPNGKLDRRALPEPSAEREEAGGDVETARTPTEELLCGLFAEVLGLAKVGREEDFFELGGHSLLATQLVSWVREAFGVEVPLRTVFERPTVAGLAEAVEQELEARRGMAAPPIRPVPRDGALPLSFAQQRLWFLDQFEPGSSFYNMPFAVRLSGELNVVALEQTLTEVVRRHEALRTTFRSEGGEPAQVVVEPYEILLPAEDLSGLGEAEREAELRRRLTGEARHPFYLATGPLLRARLLRLSEQEHVVSLVMHHIISDGWSVGVLVGEVAALYEAYAEEKESPLPELEIQYADFAAWQREYLQGEVLERQLAYWRERLGGAPPVLELPTDRPRPAVQTFNGRQHVFSIPAELAESLRALSRREGVTLYMTLLAGWQALLSRYSGQSDISVGTPIAGRTRAETEGLIGFFVNTLVMRTDLSGDPTFGELLQQVREISLGAYAHQEVPFERLVEELQPERSLSHTPLFQVMFALQNAPHGELRAPGLRLSAAGGGEGRTAKFDLSLTVVEAGAELRAVLEYNTDLFDEATATRHVGHYQRLLGGVAEDASRRLSELPLLSEEERRELLVGWNRTEGAYPEGLCIHELFEAQAGRTPEAVAVEAAGAGVTYRELNERANQLAHHLRGLGVGAESRVGLFAERSVGMLVGLLGVLKAGGAYVPLDTSYPRERLAFLLEDAGVSVLVTQRRLMSALPEQVAQVVCLDDAEALSAHPRQNLRGVVRPENMAYVIYTSGSTGRPKGVAVSHASLVNYVGAASEFFVITPADRVLQFASISFDASAEDIFCTLTSGACLVLRSDEMLATPAEFLRECGRLGVTALDLPTAYWHELVAGGVGEWEAAGDLRLVVIGGERALPHRLAEWHDGPGRRLRLVNMYGPTEATISATRKELTSVGVTAGEVPIGRPVRNMRAYVVDRRLKPVPVGTVGELHVAGVGLARGYLGRPGLTAERFIPDPFGAEPGARLYRTGDLVRYLPSGDIEFVGRVDSQVKVRGYRIELGEVEAALRAHERVRECVVTVREGESGDKRLVAYVVEGGGESAPANEELREWLRDRLPPYMTPSGFVRLESLPLTPHGKIDYEALPAPEQTATEGEASFVEPLTEAERLLASVWAEVLRLPRIGARDNFFALGGDSILSIQVVSRANRAGLPLTPKMLFRHQTVAELAAAATEARHTQSAAEQGAVTGEAPLTPIQRWFFQQEMPAHDHYNQAVMLELHDARGRELLPRVVSRLVEHHDALRLRFTPLEDGWRQSFDAPGAEPPFDYFDLSDVPAEGRRAALAAEAERLQSSLDIEGGPVMRAALFDGGEGEPARLLLVAHHLVVDGVSWRVILEDLEILYTHALAGAALSLPPKTTSYKRWTEALRESVGRGVWDAEIDYWRAVGGAAASRLPVENPGGRNTMADARSVASRLSAEQTRALLREVPRAYRTQIQDVLLAALGETLCAWGGVERVRVELEGHGREELFDDVDVSRTVGWFTSVYPVLLERVGGEDEGARLRRVKEQLRRVPRRGVGYGVLRYLWEGGSQLEPSAEEVSAKVLFNYHGQTDAALREGGLLRRAREGAGPTQAPDAPREHELEINGAVVGGELVVQWRYSGEQYSAARVEELARRFEEELLALVNHCVGEERRGYTASDFELAGLGEEELGGALGGAHGLEDLYPLSPMQEGMFLHSLLDATSPALFDQSSYAFRGRLDVAAFEGAWQQVIDRHAVLRTSFVWEGLASPLQAVWRKAELRAEQLDWRGLSEAEQKEALGAFLRADRERGLSLSAAPLMRLTLIRTGEEAYQFVWDYHGLLLDGWGVQVILKEVFACYEALCRGEAARLEPSRPYRDYIEWLGRQDAGQAEEFWRETLKGFGSPTPLDFGEPEPEAGADAYADRLVTLSEETTERLHQLARAQRVTIYTLMQGAWALLLSRYSGGPDVVFGTTVSGRPAELPGVERIIGPFINTLPVRVRVEGGERLLPWLKGLHERQLKMKDYEYSSLVQQWSDVPLGLPLFESIFVFENYPREAALREQPEGVRIRRTASSIRTKYPLTLVSGPGAELWLYVAYERGRFDAATVERLLAHLKTLLEAIAADPDRRLRELPLLDAEELRGLSATPRRAEGVASDECVHELFEQQAARTPDAVALVSGDGEVTYSELNERADQLARRLRAAGVGAETLVGVYAGRTVEALAGLLGVLKAGGAYVLLDPSETRERLSAVVEESGAGVLLTVSALLERLPETSARVMLLDDEDETAVTAHVDDAPPVSARQGAYVVYNHGAPGVAAEHRYASALLRWAREFFGHEALSQTLARGPVSSFRFVLETLAPLACGGRVVLDEGAPRALAPATSSAEASMLYLTPGELDELLRASGVPASVRVICLTGEPATPALVRRAYEQTRARAVYYLHGAWGGAVPAAATLLEPDAGSRLVAAQPVACARLSVLDHMEQPAGVGVRGQLYLACEGLTPRAGLRGEDDARAGAGLVVGELAAPVYSTGDVSRRLPGGGFELLGGAGQQRRVRGRRVNLFEVEAALARHGEVREAAVVVQSATEGGERLSAYVVAEARRTSLAAELHEHLRRALPAHTVPSSFVLLESLPHTPHGSIDRAALAALAPESGGPEEAPGAPRTPVEEMLAGIAAEVLGLGRVGVEENFFDLGGHSLLATQLVSRVREVFRIELPLRKLFEHPTVEGLAVAVGAELSAGAGLEAPPIRPVPRDGALPLSFSQQRLWFLDQLEPGSDLYNSPVAVRLRGRLDVGALERTLTEIVRRHEVLRTNFHEQNGRAVQLIREAEPVQLPLVNLSALPEAEREAAARRLTAEEARRPFDLAHDPLLRLALLRLGEQDHVVLMNMHHVVSDLWSMGVLIKEVAALYEAYAEGKESPLPELPLQYADYAAWQREWLQGEALERQLAYWRTQLGGELPVLELPTDKPRPALQTYNGGYETFLLPASLSEALRGLSRREGATLYMTLLAAWQALLSCHTGQEDIVVGSPIAGRNRGETEDLIGFLVNTLVLRVNLSGDPTFGELVRRVKEVSLGAYAHQDVPFEKLVEELQPERDLSRSPLFQVAFVYQNAGQETLQLPDLKLSSFNDDRQTAKFDLTLTMAERDGRLRGLLVYNSDLFEEATMKRMLGRFEVLLEAAALTPDARLSALPVLTETERRLLLHDWNRTAADYPRQSCVHELFEQQAALTPEAVALVYGDEEVTYRELNERANRLAHHLRGVGVGAESRVGLCVGRSAALVVGLLGILKAGGAYVPLDPSYPAERLAWMMEDAGVAALVSEEAAVEELPAFWGPVVCLDDDEVTLAAYDVENPSATATADNLAYVIYTSGSTGQPKGISIVHRAITRLVCNTNYITLGPEDRVAQASNSSFDAATFEIWGALLHGARLVGISKEVALSPAEMGRELREQGVSALFLTTALFNQLAEAAPGCFRGVRHLLFGGEAVDARRVRQVLRDGKPERLLHVYGPTESTTFATWHPVEEVGEEDVTVPIGRPLSNTELYVLDARLRPVAVGVVGELYIGGDGLARGYLKRPALTAERFVPHPFASEAGARLYRTGDLVRYLAGGEVEFVGRADHQVKVRGFRIELGEIETVLGRHAAVKDVAVVARPDERGDRRLVAYVVPTDGEAWPEAGAWRSWLKERLPDYMIPSAFVEMAQLPLTPNGKVDRKALPAPAEARAEVRGEQTGARTPTEELVAGIFCELLGVAEVGREEDFFELGGHSLLATQLVSWVREAFGVEVPLRTVFERPTVAGLAEAVEQELEARRGMAAPPIRPVPRDGALPLSFAQQRLWFLDQFEPGSSFYNMPFAVRLSGELNVVALEQTLTEVVRRHEALRTTFRSEGGEPAQVVGEPYEILLPAEDLTGLGEAEREAETRGLITEEARKPFDLSAGPLLRVRLLRLAEQEHVVSFVMHHIVSDGWSLSILLREVAALYEAFDEGRESPLEELGIQYADYAAWQREHLRGEVLEGHLAYWRERLGGELPVLELPTSRPRPAVLTRRGRSSVFVLPADLSKSLKELSRREGATLFMTLLAAFQVQLSRYSGQEDIIVGLPIANRNRAETEDLIGFFINSLALRTDLSGAPTFRELLRRVREACLGAYAHQDVPFEKLVEEVQPERDASGSPLFRVTFGLQNAPLGTLRLPGLKLGALALEHDTVRYDLTLWMSERSGQLTAAWNFNTDLFDEEDVERMQGHFVRLLESISASPDARLKSLEMLTDAEKEQQAAKDTRLEETSLRKLMSAKRKAVRPQADAPSGD